jgi:Transposase.
MDETWVHHYMSETKQQSKQLMEADGSVPKKSKSVTSAGKFHASVFWDPKGILLIEYLEKAEQLLANITLIFLTSWMSKFVRRGMG